MLDLIRPIVPISVEAWEDYHDHRGGIKLTRLEIDSIKETLSSLKNLYPDIPFNVKSLDSDNKREQQEWLLKAAKLGFE
jgi:hypothetical protein